MGFKHRGRKVVEPVEQGEADGLVSTAAHAVSGIGDGLRDVSGKARDAAATGVHDLAGAAHETGEKVRAAAERGGQAASGAKDAVAGKAIALRSQRRRVAASGAVIASAAVALLASVIARKRRPRD